jgi:hypothetical protein
MLLTNTTFQLYIPPKGSAAAEWENCHMPSKVYMGSICHDHSFRVPRPDLSKYGTPNACSARHKDNKSEKHLQMR